LAEQVEITALLHWRILGLAIRIFGLVVEKIELQARTI
jgi:hypothetical protein